MTYQVVVFKSYVCLNLYNDWSATQKLICWRSHRILFPQGTTHYYQSLHLGQDVFRQILLTVLNKRFVLCNC